jgi:hypothetical protein
MKSLSRLLRLAAPSLVALSACSGPPGLLMACPDIGWFAVSAEVRDESGEPAANGATVRVTRADGFVDERRGYGPHPVVPAAENVTGVFDVTVTKPHHEPASVRGVRVRGDRCGIPRRGDGHVSLRIRLLPGAPPVRQLVVPPHGIGLGDGNVTVQVTAFVEAEDGVSREAVWTSRDTSVVRATPQGRLTSACRPVWGAAWVVASSVADPTVRDSVPVTVYAADPRSGRCP